MERRQIIRTGIVLLLVLAVQSGIPLAAGAGEGDSMHIALERSGGFANIPLSVSVDIETLPSDQAAQLRQWIKAAQFFDLPSRLVSLTQSDRFQYQITVEEDDRRHSIEVNEPAMPETLKPLVRWLTARASRG